MPSCSSCNGGASANDELFKTALAIRRELEDHPIASQVAESVFQRFQRPESQKLKAAFAATFKEVEAVSPAGLIVGTEWRFSVPLDRIIAVADRITRGLHYYHTARRLPPGYSVTSRPMDTLSDKQMEEIVKTAGALGGSKQFQRGNGAFRYRFTSTTKDPDATLWLYCFYDTISFVSFTGPGPEQEDSTPASRAKKPERET